MPRQKITISDETHAAIEKIAKKMGKTFSHAAGVILADATGTAHPPNWGGLRSQKPSGLSKPQGSTLFHLYQDGTKKLHGNTARPLLKLGYIREVEGGHEITSKGIEWLNVWFAWEMKHIATHPHSDE